MSTNPLTKLDETKLKAFSQNLQRLVGHHERAEVLMHQMLTQVLMRQLDVEQEKAAGNPKMVSKWAGLKEDFQAFRQQYPSRNPVHFFVTAVRLERMKLKYAPIDLTIFIAPQEEQDATHSPEKPTEISITPPRRRP